MHTNSSGLLVISICISTATLKTALVRSFKSLQANAVGAISKYRGLCSWSALERWVGERERTKAREGERRRERASETVRRKGLSGKRMQCLSSATEHRGRESRDRTRERAQQWSRFIKDNGCDDKIWSPQTISKLHQSCNTWVSIKWWYGYMAQGWKIPSWHDLESIPSLSIMWMQVWIFLLHSWSIKLIFQVSNNPNIISWLFHFRNLYFIQNLKYWNMHSKCQSVKKLFFWNSWDIQ